MPLLLPLQYLSQPVMFCLNAVCAADRCMKEVKRILASSTAAPLIMLTSPNSSCKARVSSCLGEDVPCSCRCAATQYLEILSCCICSIEKGGHVWHLCRTCPGIEPEAIASFPSYRYEAAEGEVEKGIAARAVSTWEPRQETIPAVGRRASEPAMPSPSKLAAHNMDEETIKYDSTSAEMLCMHISLVHKQVCMSLDDHIALHVHLAKAEH